MQGIKKRVDNMSTRFRFARSGCRLSGDAFGGVFVVFLVHEDILLIRIDMASSGFADDVTEGDDIDDEREGADDGHGRRVRVRTAAFHNAVQRTVGIEGR